VAQEAPLDRVAENENGQARTRKDSRRSGSHVPGIVAPITFLLTRRLPGDG
jgi:hypothetical protein